MTKKDILIYTLLAAVFSLFGYTIKSSKVVVKKEVDKVEVAKSIIPEDIQVLKEKLLEIEQVDLEEYRSLKSQKEKYLKANEIYGKVFVLFLTSLSLELNKEAWNPIVKYAEDNHYVDDLEDRYEELSDASEDLKRENNFYKKNKQSQKKEESKFKRTLNNYVNKSSHDIANKKWLKRLRGTYRGSAIYNNKDNVTMTLESNYTLVDGKVQGEGRVILSDEKGDFSTNRSNGSNMLFKGINKRNTLYVDLMPGAFAELKYHSDDTFSGFIYENKSGIYKQVGKIKLLSRY